MVSVRSAIPMTAFVAAVASALAAMAAGFGVRLDWWHFSVGFSILRWAVYVAIAAVVLSVIGAFFTRQQRGMGWAAAGLVIALVVVAVPASWLYTARQVPPIHDITTDTDNPPRFDAILALRMNAPNPAHYGGPSIAAKQRQAYPNIEPMIVEASRAEVFDHAVATARRMGWAIHAADAARGRIEATDTTFWFGFKDDVVVRIQSVPQGTRVDVRSVSRVGRSDVGTNAKRIREYLGALRQAL